MSNFQFCWKRKWEERENRGERERVKFFVCTCLYGHKGQIWSRRLEGKIVHIRKTNKAYIFIFSVWIYLLAMNETNLENETEIECPNFTEENEEFLARYARDKKVSFFREKNISLISVFRIGAKEFLFVWLRPRELSQTRSDP